MNPTTKSSKFHRDVLGEIASDQVVLICGRHNYTAARKKVHGTVCVPPETRGCKECWNVYYVTDLALTPPSKRQERLDELEAVIRHAIEYEQKGSFGKDFDLYEPSDKRFEVAVEKDAADDATGQDKVTIPGEEQLS
jgi:hypothetical protein